MGTRAAPGRLIIVKYGGSVLDGGPAIRRAAETLREEQERGTGLVVVVSAIKGVTDQLLSAAATISDDTPLDVVDHIIGLGEEQSVRLMASALRSQGVEAVEVTPTSPRWPIVTDDNYGDAEPLLEECESSAELGLRPLVDRGSVPVVCGFVGRSHDGYITTLGRGGSDTTAVILARCLGAEELVLVKDVGGIYSADPKKVEEARPIEELSAWEANLLASSGAKVLHDKVFRYKPDDLRIRIVSIDQELNGSGSVITGTIPEIEVSVHEEPVMSVTVLGDLLTEPGDLTLISMVVKERGGAVLSVKGDREVTTLYVEGPPVDLLAGVHSVVESSEHVRALSGSEGLALIEVKGRSLNNMAEAIRKIDEGLSLRGIHVKSSSIGPLSLTILVDWEERFTAAKAIEGL
jgi:aspartate kinase